MPFERERLYFCARKVSKKAITKSKESIHIEVYKEGIHIDVRSFSLNNIRGHGIAWLGRAPYSYTHSIFSSGTCAHRVPACAFDAPARTTRDQRQIYGTSLYIYTTFEIYIRPIIIENVVASISLEVSMIIFFFFLFHCRLLRPLKLRTTLLRENKRRMYISIYTYIINSHQLRSIFSRA